MVLDLLAPLGPVYQAGTLSGNPLSATAGIETLKILAQPGIYEALDTTAARLENGFRRALEKSNRIGTVNRVGSLLTLFFGIGSVSNADDARRADTADFAKFFRAMLDRGIYLPPSQFEALFMSLAHSDADIDATIEAATESLVSI